MAWQLRKQHQEAADHMSEQQVAYKALESQLALAQGDRSELVAQAEAAASALDVKMSECHELATALSDAGAKAAALQDAIKDAERRCEMAEEALAASEEQKASLDVRYNETIQTLASAEEALRAEANAKRELEERYNVTIKDFQEQLLVVLTSGLLRGCRRRASSAFLCIAAGMALVPALPALTPRGMLVSLWQRTADLEKEIAALGDSKAAKEQEIQSLQGAEAAAYAQIAELQAKLSGAQAAVAAESTSEKMYCQ